MRVKYVEDLEWMVIHAIQPTQRLAGATRGSGFCKITSEQKKQLIDLGKSINRLGRQLDKIQAHQARIESKTWVEEFYEVATSLYNLRLGEVGDRPSFVGKMMRCVLQYYGFTLRDQERAYGNRVRSSIVAAVGRSRTSGTPLLQTITESKFLEELFEVNGKEDTRTIEQKLRLRKRCEAEFEDEFRDFVDSLLVACIETSP